MKTNRLARACGAALLATAFLALAPSSHAADLVYYVTLDLSSLIGHPNQPFSLDFDLATGSSTAGHGNVANTVTLSNFIFTGGTPTGTPNFTMGGQSGSFASSIVLTNSALNNEFAEAFTIFPTKIQFKVDETTNDEVVGSGTPIPDQFSIYLDDNNTQSGFAPTTDPSGADALVSSAIHSGMLINSVASFSTISPDGGVTTTISATPVPEPGSAALLLLGGAGLVARRKRTTAPQAA
jgi:hypothetical protein